jgi:hypothetical protein
MPRKQDALAIVDEFIQCGETASFSFVAFTAKQIADVLQERFQTDNHSMPMCCAAMQTRFQQGRDFFRRGKDRHDWHDCINAEPSSTFEILFALPR